MGKIIKIIHDPETQELYIDCPYSFGFNRDITAGGLCKKGRSPWSESLRMWVVESEYLDEVEALLEFYFPKVTTVFLEERVVEIQEKQEEKLL